MPYSLEFQLTCTVADLRATEDVLEGRRSYGEISMESASEEEKTTLQANKIHLQQKLKKLERLVQQQQQQQPDQTGPHALQHAPGATKLSCMYTPRRTAVFV